MSTTPKTEAGKRLSKRTGWGNVNRVTVRDEQIAEIETQAVDAYLQSDEFALRLADLTHYHYGYGQGSPGTLDDFRQDAKAIAQSIRDSRQ